MYTTADGMPVTTSGLTSMPFARPRGRPRARASCSSTRAIPSTYALATTGKPAARGSRGQPVRRDEEPHVLGAADAGRPSGTDNGHLVADHHARRAVGPLLARRRLDTRNGHGDLYFASAMTPNQEVRLAKLDGDSYPFAAGPRDLSWNFEPSFAPVAAGGYFWVVFTSRRTYGNTLTGQARAVLEAARGTAIDWLRRELLCGLAASCACPRPPPSPGVDPSHPALPPDGQDETNLAMRGFWSLPPCAEDGQGLRVRARTAAAGTAPAGDDGGAPVCRSMPRGARRTATSATRASDCCNARAGRDVHRPRLLGAAAAMRGVSGAASAPASAPAPASASAPRGM